MSALTTVIVMTIFWSPVYFMDVPICTEDDVRIDNRPDSEYSWEKLKIINKEECNALGIKTDE